MDLCRKRVLVTGAKGFIGCHLCKVLHNQGAHIIGVSRSPSSSNSGSSDQYVVDVSDQQKIQQLVKDEQPEMVVHLAASKNRSLEKSDWRSGYETNLFGSINLIEACLDLPAFARFVFIGSCEEYGQQQVPFNESLRESPVSAYGVTKLAVTQFLQSLARAHGFASIILRPTVVYGPGQAADMFLPALIKSLVSGNRFAMTPGEQTRDYLYIDDLVDAILRALTVSDLNGQAVNVCSGLSVHINDLAKKIALLVGQEAESLIDFGVRDYRPGEVMSYAATNLLARRLLKWSPSTSLEDGLERTVQYYRSVVLNG